MADETGVPPAPQAATSTMAGVFRAPTHPIGLYNPALERDACGVGFIADMGGGPTHKTVTDALTMLERMDHRGACGCDAAEGDGAGILVRIPHDFFVVVLRQLGTTLPPAGKYALAMVFLPPEPSLLQRYRSTIEIEAASIGLSLLKWRKVPGCNESLGRGAKATNPLIEQIFFTLAAPINQSCNNSEAVSVALETRCFLLQKRVMHKATKAQWDMRDFHFCSVSSKTVVYKGMFLSWQVKDYYQDLRDDLFRTNLAMVHSRFATNTFPSWSRAQPLRVLCHNGEINTLRGNKNWMKARQGLISCSQLGISPQEVSELLPIISEDTSDSGAMDDLVQLLIACGRPAPEAMMLLIPEAWQNDPLMDEKRRAFYEFNSNVLEPWDGPALVAFTDGRYLGATLDRNGLRPGRYYETYDNRVIMASEFGVIDIPPANIKRKGRLSSGKMLMVDFQEGRLVEDKELKERFTSAYPFADWLTKNVLDISDFPLPDQASSAFGLKHYPLMADFVPTLKQHGWTKECIDLLLLPTLNHGMESLGSMGNDAALAFLSNCTRPIYDYFKQLFAQVTNPPLDSTREYVVMSMECMVGPEGDMTCTDEQQCARLRLKSPLISVEDLTVLDATYPVSDGAAGLMAAIKRVCMEAIATVDAGHQLIIISDREAGPERIPIPSLMACGAVHHALVHELKRLRVALLIDSGDAREVHHFCCLLGFGADAICPRVAFEVMQHFWAQEGAQKSKNPWEQYTYAVTKGILKVMAKMGISTVQSYKGAQIFEAVGLAADVIDLCFVDTASRINGLGLAELGAKLTSQHHTAHPAFYQAQLAMPNPGQYHYRSVAGSELHLNDPVTIAHLQDAARTNSRKAFSEYSRLTNEINTRANIRGLLQFRPARSIPLEDVEPAAAIVKRFCTGAMSYGSISLEAHSTLARAMNKMGGKSNTGEGGEAFARLRPSPDGTVNLERSAIKQVASGRFGVTSLYLTNADELQIKMAQGAKPGEGGELPGGKVNGPIAEVRMSTPGVGLISPPPHHDIYSIEDLKQLIFDLKNANPQARISVKLVSEVGVGVIAAGVVKGLADHILISGHDGGTGASRWTGIKNAGLPWELGLAETQQTLVLNNLRGRVVLQVDGQFKTGRDVVIGALLGAEEFGFSTAPLIAMGCIMMRKCHLNTCPVGIATQDPELRAKFAGTPEHVMNFFFLLAEEVRNILAQLGCRSLDEVVGRSEMLEANRALLDANLALRNVSLEALLKPAHKMRADVNVRCLEKQDHGLAGVLDQTLITKAFKSLQKPPRKTFFVSRIQNTDRAVGTMLSHMVTKQFGYNPLPDDTISILFHGSAGQSFGAWVCQGITLNLRGDANDFVGKGLCGGRLIICPPDGITFVAQDNWIVGNVAMYGATGGEVYIRGRAAERFCVRNSGAYAVVEGVGDHGCEYMTGGRVVILGPTGRNFGAGMSGGIAYVWDPNHQFESLCNNEMVDALEVQHPNDKEELHSMLEQHLLFTHSVVAAKLLMDWDVAVMQFRRVLPREYGRILAAERAAAALLADDLRTSMATGSADAVNPSKKIAALQLNAADSMPVEPVIKLYDIEDTNNKPAMRPTITSFPTKKRGFIEYERQATDHRPAKERLKDWAEITAVHPESERLLRTQTARCMDCGVPFCHQKHSGCPLGNLIPEWNEYVYRGDWKNALTSLLSTNNFPEFTGRVCPAPCEGACVLGIIEKPVTIKSVECSIIDRGFSEGWIQAIIPQRTGKRVAIVGSGPAGLAAADQLNRAGHLVTVYERADRIGGLMMYGVPNMKTDKQTVVQRRVDLMTKEGVDFLTNAEVGKTIMPQKLLAQHDALLLAVGATVPRDLLIPGREHRGIYFAMEFLTKNTKSLLDSNHVDGQYINVRGKHVIVVGGGDTGNDCIGTSMRQGAASVVNFELLPSAPVDRAADNPWPQWPRIFRVDYGHEEVRVMHGADPRQYCIKSTQFLDDGQGQLTGIETVRVEWVKDDKGGWQMNDVPGSAATFQCDFVFLAMGFLGPEALLGQTLDLKLDKRSNIQADFEKFATSVPGVFAAGDCRRGQSLVVWAIAEGRGAAREIDRYLMGSTALP